MLEPDLGFVVDSRDGVEGYLFGVLDTKSFNARLLCDWYSALQQRVADPGPDPPEWWHNSDWGTPCHSPSGFAAVTGEIMARQAEDELFETIVAMVDRSMRL